MRRGSHRGPPALPLRVPAEDEPGCHVQPGVPTGTGIRDRQRDQTSYPAKVGRGGCARVGQDPEVHRVAAVHEGGVGRDWHAGHDSLNGLRDRAEGPRRGTRHRDVVGGAGEHRSAVRGMGTLQDGQVAPLPQDRAVLVDHPVARQQVQRHPRELPVGRGDPHACDPRDRSRHPLQDRLLGQLGGRQEPGHQVRCGTQLAADRLRRAAQQGRHEVGAQARSSAGDLGRIELGEQCQRDICGDSVCGIPGFERVGEVERDLGPGAPAKREVVLLGQGLVRDTDLLGGQREQVRGGPPRLLPPRVEVPHGGDVSGDARVVERELALVVDHEPPSPAALLDLLGCRDGSPVGVPELMPGAPLALDEGATDEQLAAQWRVDASVVDGPPGHQRDAEQGDALAGDGRSALG